jgi:hypothetical protein
VDSAAAVLQSKFYARVGIHATRSPKGRQKLKKLLLRNVRAENPKMDAAAVCDLVSVFFSGISIEANLDLDPLVARDKVANFIRMLRGL